MTEKLFYKDAYMTGFDAVVFSCTKNEKKEEWLVELDRTAFYPEGGGQPYDTGILSVRKNGEENAEIEVTEVHEKNDVILHTVKSEIPAGTQVHGEIDWARRFDHMQQHSGEHIVSGMICSQFHCDNVGFHMGKDIITIDYNAAVTMDELREIEKRANAYISEDHAFVELWPTAEELKKLEYRSKKELTGAVRITSFPGADMCACCGTHVKNSAQVGLVKFLSCTKVSKGTRMELVCGKRAVDFLTMNYEQNSANAVAMAASLDNTHAVYMKQRNELIEAKLRISQLEDVYFASLAESYRGQGNVLVFEKDLNPDGVRKLCVMIGGVCGGSCAVFSGVSGSYKYAVLSGNGDNRAFVKEMNAALNGRGGGKDGFAQGSVQASEEAVRMFFSAK